MAKTITQRELRNDSGEIMRRLDRGEAFLITRHGVPIGELLPQRRAPYVATSEVLAIFRQAPRIDPQRFREDVDSYLDQDPTPRG